jgi:hypothetical protein
VAWDLDCLTGSCGRHGYWGPFLVPKTVLSAELMRIFVSAGGQNQPGMGE